jgi:hypothetical protein
LEENMLILQLAGWLVLSCVLMSFIEHQVHAKLMHRRNYFSDRSAKYKRVFEAHAMVHHKHYSKIFSDEPVPVGEDQEIRLTVRKAPMKSLPVTIPLALIWWPGALVFMGVMTLHHWIWNKIHLQMHKPEERVFKNWSAYKFLAEYHWLHHRYPNKNFNVVLPFADYVLGTCARPKQAALDCMREQLYGIGASKQPYWGSTNVAARKCHIDLKTSRKKRPDTVGEL